MKKILLATTVLVGTAGFASAEVTLSGNARMGIVNDGTNSNFSSRVRADIAMSGETDGGLSFGGSFGVHDAGAAAAGTAGSVFISGAFGKLSMGNVAGAAEAAVGDLAGVGYVGVGAYTDTLFLTGDGTEAEPIIQYAYTAGDLSVYASTTDGAQIDNRALGVSYKMGDYNFGVGYETASVGAAGTNSHLALGVGGTFGAVAVKAVYGAADLETALGADAGSLTQMGLSAVYTMDALSVTGFYKNVEQDNAAGVNTGSVDAYGIGVAYDLGGGAAVKGMVSSLKDNVALIGDTNPDDTVYDLGVTFSF